MRMLALMTDAYGGRGGIAQYNRDLVAALAGAAGVDAIAILPRQTVESVGSLPPSVTQYASPKTRICYAIEVLVRAAWQRPEVVFCGHINLAPLAAFASRIAGSKLVMQFHGIEAWAAPSAMKRQAVDKANLVLCVSRYTRGKVLGWSGLEPEKLVVLPNTVSEIFSLGNRQAARARFGLADEKILLTVGRLSSRERYKGHDAVIGVLPELAEALGDVIYLVAGEGDDLPRLSELAEQVGVKERVRFLGAVAPVDLPDVYRAADLFVMPSIGEGFGIAFLEAMACGTPALGLAVAGACDPLGDGELGIATSEDQLSCALARALAAPRAEPKAVAAAVRGRFSEEAFARQVANLLRHLAAMPAAAIGARP